MTQSENTKLATIEEDKQQSSFVAMRRKVLGALAIGVVASACSSTDDALETANSQVPGSAAPGTSTGTSSTAQAVVDATGPELDLVKLPVTVDPDTVPLVVGSDTQGAAGAQGTASGSQSATAQSSAGASASGSTAAGTSVAAADGDVMTVTDASVTPAANDDVDAGTVMTSEDTIVAGAGGSSAVDASSPATPTETTTPAPVTPVTPKPSAVPDVLLANRVTFGVTPAVLAEISRLGGGGFIEDQLRRTGPDAATEKRLASYNLLKLNSKQVFEATRGSGKLAPFFQQMTHSNIIRATYSKNQLFENMCHLWMDHFNAGIIAEGGKRYHMVEYQEKVIRPNAMGSFRDLLKATANAPAMLVYLDNDDSNANSPQGVNENYGRELLELHTLGIDRSGKQVYTEADVRSASMAMSGWSVAKRRKDANFGQFVFNPKFHHTGSISLLNGAWTRGATSGKATGESLLNFLATHPSTARYVAYKICRRFVSDSPSEALVNSTAAVFLQNDTAIVPTVRHVLNSAEFAASAGMKIRRPFEHMVATFRALNANLPNNPGAKGANRLRATLRSMDHEPWYWPQPDGYPDAAADWLTTDGLSNRWTTGALTARNKIPDITMSYASFKPSSGTVGDLIGGLSQRFGIGASTPAIASAIATATKLEVGTAAASISDEQLADIIGLVIAHPIFQTR